MISNKKLIRAALWIFILLLFACPGFAGDTAPAKKSQPAAKSVPSQPDQASDKSAQTGIPMLQPEDVPVPINAEKIDEAGEALGKSIDKVGNNASKSVGKWIGAIAFGGISWLRLLVCVGLLLFVTGLDWVIRRLINMRLRRCGTELNWCDLLLESLTSPLSLFVKVYGIYWALSPIWASFDSPGGFSLVHRAAGKAADFGGTIALFWFIYRFISIADSRMHTWTKAGDKSINDMLFPLISKTVKGFVIVVGGIMVVQNMTGIEIGPLVASLGIGGLAFALAGKDSIANFLGSLTILLDKPFQVGERIIIDKHDGFVEEVGFRSTRLRTLTGNLVSIPNEKIINSPLENIGKRSYLRWSANFGLTCSTPPEKVERAVEIISGILENHEGMRPENPPRVHFNGFNDWSLNISVFAWYFPGDFWKYQEWLQRTCLEIMRRFRDEGIELAYPTQAVYNIDSGETDPDRLGMVEPEIPEIYKAKA